MTTPSQPAPPSASPLGRYAPAQVLTNADLEAWSHVPTVDRHPTASASGASRRP